MLPRDIKRIRTKLGLKQGQFAGMLHVRRETVVRWERGKMKPQRVFETILRQIHYSRPRPVTVIPMTPRLLKRWRLKLGVSQTKLAELLHVTRYTVVRWEAGTQSPHPALVAAMQQLRFFCL